MISFICDHQVAVYAHHFYTIVLTDVGPSVWKRGVIFKVRLSPQGHLFSQYYELYISALI